MEMIVEVDHSARTPLARATPTLFVCRYKQAAADCCCCCCSQVNQSFASPVLELICIFYLLLGVGVGLVVGVAISPLRQSSAGAERKSNDSFSVILVLANSRVEVVAPVASAAPSESEVAQMPLFAC